MSLIRPRQVQSAARQVQAAAAALADFAARHPTLRADLISLDRDSVRISLHGNNALADLVLWEKALSNCVQDSSAHTGADGEPQHTTSRSAVHAGTHFRIVAFHDADDPLRTVLEDEGPQRMDPFDYQLRRNLTRAATLAGLLAAIAAISYVAGTQRVHLNCVTRLVRLTEPLARRMPRVQVIRPSSTH
ncbi:hypothetical protein AB0N09_05245 [Streptomyces erythrochromogenes]|uniref:hypothetical protein n=1 Tax=Streptomyces erythrochromogenes TaxID=285574 RepID=UPI00341EDD3E